MFSAIVKNALSRMAQRTIDPPISWLMKLALDRPNLISLAAGFTDNASLPVNASAELLHGILEEPSLARASLQYGATSGDFQLRDLTLRRLAKLDGVAARNYSPENLIITHGSQQLLYLVTECLCDEGDIVLVEDPTYFVYLSILQSRAVQARGVALESDGLDLQALEQKLEALKISGELSRVKMLYVVSYFQNPSAITTSIQKKRAVLDLLRRYERAAGHPLYLLEDAAYRELVFAQRDVPSALSLKPARDRVIYAGTYSKPFATGVRVGYGWLPDALVAPVTRVKGNHDFGTSHLLQQLIRAALHSGKYDAHLPVLRERYRRKGEIMSKAIRAHFPDTVQWSPATGGLYVWVRLPEGLNAGPNSKFFRECLERGVLYVPGELCYAPDSTRIAPQNEARLSFGSASEKNLSEGIARMGQVLREFAGSPRRPRKLAPTQNVAMQVRH